MAHPNHIVFVSKDVHPYYEIFWDLTNRIQYKYKAVTIWRIVVIFKTLSQSIQNIPKLNNCYHVELLLLSGHVSGITWSCCREDTCLSQPCLQ